MKPLGVVLSCNFQSAAKYNSLRMSK